MIATQAFIKTIKSIPTNNILGLARTIENQAKARIGKKLNADIKKISNSLFKKFKYLFSS
ncbi:unnamed protein product [Rotaria sordida]|uniref:Uncharacterized protein n=1 Tax=Rotaria sordida TaxID=392033 RepID=A0A815T0S3_9BILA|nr:unnamed protein product [Rotaria sordida]